MGGWVDGWMGGWVDGWMGGWVDGWVDGWMGGWVDGWVGGCMDAWMVGGWIDGLMYGGVDVWRYVRMWYHLNDATKLLSSEGASFQLGLQVETRIHITPRGKNHYLIQKQLDR